MDLTCDNCQFPIKAGSKFNVSWKNYLPYITCECTKPVKVERCKEECACK